MSKHGFCVCTCASIIAFALVTVFASGAFAQACTDITSCNFSSLNGILLIDGKRFKSLADAVAACPQTCWIIDNLPEKFSTNPFSAIGNKSVQVTLGRGTWLTDTTIVVPTKSQLEGSGRGDPGFSGTVIQASTSFPPNAPVVDMGNAATSMGVRVENLTIDCNNIAGCIGLQNVRSQEQSGARHVLIENITGVGLDIEGSAAQNSGPYEDMEFAGGIDFNVTTASLCARIINVPAFRGMHGATCNFNNYEIHPAIGIQMDTTGTLNDIHIEGATTGIGVGVSVPASGAMLQNIYGGGPNMQTLVHVYSGREILLTGLVRSTTPNLVKYNGHTVHSAQLGFYVVHNAGHHAPGAAVYAPPSAVNSPTEPPSRFEAESYVESAEAMSVCSGTVTLDAKGQAEVQLPESFDTASREFRYQLTPVGAAASLFVAQEIRGRTFRIAGGSPGLKVSWQVSGIRHEPEGETPGQAASNN